MCLNPLCFGFHACVLPELLLLLYGKPLSCDERQYWMVLQYSCVSWVLVNFMWRHVVNPCCTCALYPCLILNDGSVSQCLYPHSLYTIIGFLSPVSPIHLQIHHMPLKTCKFLRLCMSIVLSVLLTSGTRCVHQTYPGCDLACCVLTQRHCSCKWHSSADYCCELLGLALLSWGAYQCVWLILTASIPCNSAGAWDIGCM